MDHKNQPFHKRLHFALSGIKDTWRNENSFKTHIIAAIGVFALLVVLKPAPLWWAVITLTVVGVLAAELFNTALEHVVDKLHPEVHPLIAKAKDCAAGAVLVLSIGALGVFAAFLFQYLGPLTK